MKLLTLTLVLVLGFMGVAFAQEAPPALGASLEALIAAFGAGKVAIILAVTQLLKTDLLGNILGKIHKGAVPLLVLILGLVVGAIEAQVGGASFMMGMIQGLFSGGFAIALYDVAIKHFVKKK